MIVERELLQLFVTGVWISQWGLVYGQSPRKERPVSFVPQKLAIYCKFDTDTMQSKRDILGVRVLLKFYVPLDTK